MTDLTVDADGPVCSESMTDAWRKGGRLPGLTPALWATRVGTKAALAATADALGTTPDKLIDTRDGQRNGSWAVPAIYNLYVQDMERLRAYRGRPLPAPAAAPAEVPGPVMFDATAHWSRSGLVDPVTAPGNWYKRSPARRLVASELARGVPLAAIHLSIRSGRPGTWFGQALRPEYKSYVAAALAAGARVGAGRPSRSRPAPSGPSEPLQAREAPLDGTSTVPAAPTRLAAPKAKPSPAADNNQLGVGRILAEAACSIASASAGTDDDRLAALHIIGLAIAAV